MADETPPLDEARLEQMRGYAEAIRTAKRAIESVSSELVIASDYMLTLIAEVDRLRAREARLQDAIKYQDNFLVRALPGEEYAFVAKMVRRLIDETPQE